MTLSSRIDDSQSANYTLGSQVLRYPRQLEAKERLRDRDVQRVHETPPVSPFSKRPTGLRRSLRHHSPAHRTGSRMFRTRRRRDHSSKRDDRMGPLSGHRGCCRRRCASVPCAPSMAGRRAHTAPPRVVDERSGRRLRNHASHGVDRHDRPDPRRHSIPGLATQARASNFARVRWGSASRVGRKRRSTNI